MIVDLEQYKKNKKLQTEFANERTPLYVSHLNNTASGSKEDAHEKDFGNRLTRIRDSLAKINNLISDLKRRNEGRE